MKEVSQHITQIGCPTQRNGINCGLFAAMNCLHIFGGVPITESIFTQQLITHLHNILPFLLVQEKDTQCYYICNIFPQLKAVMVNNLLEDEIQKYAKIDDDHSSSSSSSSSSSAGDNKLIAQTDINTKLPTYTNTE